MAKHRVYLGPPLPRAGEPVELNGPEARHAFRVKRLAAGDTVDLLDGEGNIAGCIVENARDPTSQRRRDSDLVLRIISVRTIEPTKPRVDVFTATPKGGHVDELVDALSQVGAAYWTPLRTERTVVDPRDSKLERLARIAAEASKQCGRAWLLKIGPVADFDAVIAQASPPTAGAPDYPVTVLADATGSPFTPTGCASIRLLIGPEGGWTERELGAAADAGARIASFGPHIMRIETAATVAAGVILAAELAGAHPSRPRSG
jgi:16S rRNA (uracil1498-N3)-methyltransferase